MPRGNVEPIREPFKELPVEPPAVQVLASEVASETARAFGISNSVAGPGFWH